MPLPEIHITADSQLADKTRQMVGEELAPRALAAAAKKTADKLRTRMARDIAAASKLKYGEVKKRTWANAVVDEGGATVVFGSSAYPAIRFGALDQYPRGVSVEDAPDSKNWPHAFIATGPKRGRQVFQRQGKDRERLRTIMHHDPSTLAKMEGGAEKYEQFILKDLATQIDSQIDRFLEKAL